MFPVGAVVEELRCLDEAEPLHPSERPFTAGFSPKRLADFTGGRTCARRALRAFGYDDVALVPNDDRTVRWPPGITGSITHTGGYCAAVVAEQRQVSALGIDAEIVGGVRPEFWHLLFTPIDRAQLAAAETAVERACLATVIFSVKEAFYKCQYALSSQWVDFDDVTIRVKSTPVGGTFTVEAATLRPSLTRYLPAFGRYEVNGELVITGIAMQRD